MYRLTVVSGPTRGASYTLKDGENGIGRLDDNAIPLRSSRVSKRHCVLIAKDGELLVRDEGSSNGTFVNGVLTRERKIASGDRVSVGEFIFEVSEVAARKPRRELSLVPAIPVSIPASPLPQFDAPAFDPAAAPPPPVERAPADLKGKLVWALEKYVMPTFYSMNLKSEWRSIGLLVFLAFVAVNLVISIQPVLDTSRRAVVKEAKQRAKFIAQQIAERNSAVVSAGAESRADIGSVEFADTVVLAVLTDLDGRVIAPAKRAGQYLTTGSEAIVANRARELFRNGRENGIAQEIGSDTVVAVEPLLVLNPSVGRNVVAAMAVVSVDTAISTLGLGEMGLIYSESLVFTVLLGLLALWILYRLTLKPIETLNDDLDRVLKGELSQVTHEFKGEEFDSLYNLINSLAQRVPKGASDLGAGFGEAEYRIEDALPALKLLAGDAGLAVCDAQKRIVFLSDAFEETTGIRMDANLGQDLSAVARDQAFGVLISDLWDRCAAAESATEEFDFSGVAHRVSAAAISGQKGFVLLVRRAES